MLSTTLPVLDIPPLAYLGGKEYLNDDTVYFEQRKDTFIRYCKEHQISYEPYLKETEFSADAGYQMMMELIEAGTLPSAVFAISLSVAIIRLTPLLLL